MTTLYDMSLLPAPAVVETLDFETIFAAMLADLQARDATFSALVESDPAYKVLEVCAYRELLLRQRINDAARSVMLAYAAGSDLDHLAARHSIERLAGESDGALRDRVRLAYHQVAAAGSYNMYLWHALSAHADVAQADVWQVSPGVVNVAVLARAEKSVAEVGTDDAAIGAALFGIHASAGTTYVAADTTDAPVAAARTRILSDAVRPIGVDVSVVTPDISAYQIEAVIVVPNGPDPQQVLARAQAELAAALAEITRFRVDVHRTALSAALMVDGVRTVEISSPAADIARSEGEIAVCTAAALSVEVRDD